MLSLQHSHTLFVSHVHTSLISACVFWLQQELPTVVPSEKTLADCGFADPLVCHPPSASKQDYDDVHTDSLAVGSP